jgi:hypothetical protein
MRSDEELRRVLARPDLPWPDETGAYERFLRRRGARRGRVVAAAGLALVAVLGAAVLVTRQLPQEREPAAPATNAAEPTPRPHQWVYSRELRVESGGGKPYTIEFWHRVDGKKFINAASSRRTAGAPKVQRERMQLLPVPQGCPPGQPQRIRPAVGLGKWFPYPAAVPTDPDGLLAAVYRLVEDPACAPLVGDTGPGLPSPGGPGGGGRPMPAARRDHHLRLLCRNDVGGRRVVADPALRSRRSWTPRTAAPVDRRGRGRGAGAEPAVGDGHHDRATRSSER